MTHNIKKKISEEIRENRIVIKCSEDTKRKFKKLAADVGGNYEDAIKYFTSHYKEIEEFINNNKKTQGKVL